MSAPCPLAVLEKVLLMACDAHDYTDEVRVRANAALTALAELVEHLRDLSRGMPVSYEDNARVIGNSNALALQRLREDLAKFGGAR